MFSLRLPESLEDFFKVLAKVNRRSVNGELIFRLETIQQEMELKLELVHRSCDASELLRHALKLCTQIEQSCDVKLKMYSGDNNFWYFRDETGKPHFVLRSDPSNVDGFPFWLLERVTT